MPADIMNKTKIFERNFKCVIKEREDAIEDECSLDKNLVRCYTDGSKFNGRVGAGFYIENPDNLPIKQASFYLGKHSTVFQAEVFAISQVAKNLCMEEMQNQDIVVLVDSQSAINAIQSNIVKSHTVLNCIENLNELGKLNHISIAWTPAHTGIHGNEMADDLAKSGSRMDVEGPEPFIKVPYASCTGSLRDWTKARWKSSWTNRKDCMRTKENVGWASSRLAKRLLSLKRPHLNQVLQVLTGHCNLQRHKKTTGRSESSMCPKCNLEEETPNHHVGSCTYYLDIRKKCLGVESTTLLDVVNKLNISKLASYLKQTGRLAEYVQ